MTCDQCTAIHVFGSFGSAQKFPVVPYYVCDAFLTWSECGGDEDFVFILFFVLRFSFSDRFAYMFLYFCLGGLLGSPCLGSNFSFLWRVF